MASIDGGIDDVEDAAVTPNDGRDSSSGEATDIFFSGEFFVFVLFRFVLILYLPFFRERN